MKDKKLEKIVDVLIDEVHPREIILFVSRAKEKFFSNSDYDIALDSNPQGLREKIKVKERIEQIIGLHKMNLVSIREVDDGFRKIIEKTGRIIFLHIVA